MKLLTIFCSCALLICCSNRDTSSDRNMSVSPISDEGQLRKIISIDTLNEYIKHKKIFELENISYLKLSDTYSSCEFLPAEFYKLINLDSIILFNFGKLSYLSDSLLLIKELEYFSVKFAPNIEVIDSRIWSLKTIEFLSCGAIKLIEAPIDGVYQESETNSLTSEAILNSLSSNPDLHVLENLRITNSDLKILPKSIFNCVNLKHLIINENYIKVIDKDIVKLTSLTQINLSSNKITIFPIAIFALPNIEEVIISGNNIKILPTPDSYPPQLKRLDLTACNFKEFPLQVCDIETLEELRIAQNHITKIPKEIAKMQNLKILDLGMNKIKKLPEELKSLRQLEILIVSFDLSNEEVLELKNIYNKALPRTEIYFHGNM